MSNQIPLAVADFQTQTSTTVAIAGTTFSIASAIDDDGNALPAGKYCFTIDNGKTTKEYLLGQLNGTDVTSVVRVSRQGVETSGAEYKHRIGAIVIITDFATIQRVADVLRGSVALDGDNPIAYDAEPSLTDRKELATVAYVIDTAAGGTVAFDNQTVAGTAGETVADGDLVYFKTSDQEWYLTDADTIATVEGVQLGIALGAGTDGVAITGDILVNGIYTTTGLTAGSEYYAGNTAGAYTSSAGTVSRIIGLAFSTTKLFLYPSNPQTVTSNEKAALVGTSGTPSSTNVFVTEDTLPSDVQTFTSAGADTWTKPSVGTYAYIEVWGGGGSGCSDNYSLGWLSAAGGGGGQYVSGIVKLSLLGTTEAVTVGSGGASVTGDETPGIAGDDSTFGVYLTAGGGGGAGTSGTPGGGGTGTSSLVNILSEDGGAGGGANAGNATDGEDTNVSGAGGGSYGRNYTTGYHTGVGGTSTYGGDGGDRATVGVQPGGGGGGQGDATSGAGGDGKVIVTVF